VPLAEIASSLAVRFVKAEVRRPFALKRATAKKFAVGRVRLRHRRDDNFSRRSDSGPPGRAVVGLAKVLPFDLPVPLKAHREFHFRCTRISQKIIVEGAENVLLPPPQSSRRFCQSYDLRMFGVASGFCS